MSDSQFEDLSSYLPNPKLKKQIQSQKIDIKNLLRQKSDITQKNAQLKSRFEILTQELTAKDNLIKTITADMVRLSKKIIDQEQQSITFKQEMLATDLQYKKNLQEHLQQKTQLIQINQNLNQKLYNLNQQLQSSNQRHQTMSDKSNHLQVANAQLEKELSQKKSEIQTIRSSCTQVQNKFEQMQTKYKILSQKVQILQNQKQLTSLRLVQLTMKNEKLIQSKEQQAETISQAQREVQDVKCALELKLNQFKNKIALLQNNSRVQIQQLTRKKQDLNNLLCEKQHEIVSLHLTVQKISEDLKSLAENISGKQSLKSSESKSDEIWTQKFEKMAARQIELQTDKIEYEHRLKDEQNNRIALERCIQELNDKNLKQKQLLMRQHIEIQTLLTEMQRQNTSRRNYQLILKDLTDKIAESNNRQLQMTAKMTQSSQKSIFLEEKNEQLQTKMRRLQQKVAEYEQVFNQLKAQKMRIKHWSQQVQTQINLSQVSHLKEKTVGQEVDLLKKRNAHLQKDIKELEECFHVIQQDAENYRKENLALKESQQICAKQIALLQSEVLQKQSNHQNLQKQYEDYIKVLLQKISRFQNRTMLNHIQKSKLLNEHSLESLIVEKIKEFMIELQKNVAACNLEQKEKQKIKKDQKNQLVDRIKSILFYNLKDLRFEDKKSRQKVYMHQKQGNSKHSKRYLEKN